MKKLLAILALSLLLSGNAFAGVFDAPEKTFFGKIKWAIKDLNPVDYFEKRKKCQEWADRMDTVAIGKQRYKSCIDSGHSSLNCELEFPRPFLHMVSWSDIHRLMDTRQPKEITRVLAKSLDALNAEVSVTGQKVNLHLELGVETPNPKLLNTERTSG